MSRRKRKTNRYADDAIVVTSTVVSIEYTNAEVGESIKNVFYLKSSKYPEHGRMCVSWGKCNAKVGDEVCCRGRINEQGTFLIWQMLIIKRCDDEV